MLVTIVGKQGSGKSTLATTLTKNGFRKVSFAEPIKRHFTELFGHSNYDRAWMQAYGEGSRQVQDNIWLEQANVAIESFLPGNVVIDDARYSNEIQGTIVPYMTRVDGMVIKLHANELTRFLRRYHNAGISKNTVEAIKRVAYDPTSAAPPPSFDGSPLLYMAGEAGIDDKEMTKVYNWTQFQEHKSETDLDNAEWSKYTNNYAEFSTDALSAEEISYAVLGEVERIQKEINAKTRLL